VKKPFVPTVAATGCRMQEAGHERKEDDAHNSIGVASGGELH
jgi:hypothetical protein